MRLRRRAEKGDPRPLHLPGAPGAGRGVLLLHGFTGTPFEMGLLAADLHRRGYTCAAPLLAGHGQDAAALSRTTFHDWLGSAEAALLDLHAELSAQGTPRLAVVGLSMGGLLALSLCRRHGGLIQALGALATPLWLPAYQQRILSALGRSPLRGLHLPKLAGADVRDPVMRRRNPSTPAMPLPALLSLCELMAQERARLREVRAPAIIAHGVRDHTAPYACMEALLGGLGTPQADLRSLSLPQSYHLITLDVEHRVLLDAIAEHLARYLGPAPR